jgi:hypothetical protein
MNEIPCICGHLNKFHNIWPTRFGEEWCLVIINPDEPFNDLAEFKQCGCLKYTPDNLSYIEQLAKQKGLV